MLWNDEFTPQVVHIDIANDKVAPAGWNKQIIYVTIKHTIKQTNKLSYLLSLGPRCQAKI